MTQAITPDSALKRAVALVGSQGAMARLCGVKQPSVWRWLNRMGELPAEHVLKVEAATGVSRHFLRPDIYPIEGNSVPPLPSVAEQIPAGASSKALAGNPNWRARGAASLMGGAA